MTFGRNHDECAHGAASLIERPVHGKGISERAEVRLERCGVRSLRLNTQEEATGINVTKLLGFENVPALGGKGAGDSVNDSGPVGAGNRKNKVCHAFYITQWNSARGSAMAICPQGTQPGRYAASAALGR